MNQMLPNAWPIQKRLCKRHARKMKERERDGRNEKGMKGRGEEAQRKHIEPDNLIFLFDFVTESNCQIHRTHGIPYVYKYSVHIIFSFSSEI